MKYLYFIIILLLFISCSPIKLLYSTASNIDDVSQVPITNKEKGDFSTEVSGTFQSGGSIYSYLIHDYRSVEFRSVGNILFNIKSQYSLLDDISVGLIYQRAVKSNKNLSYGNTIGPSFNYSKNFYTPSQKAVVGFDILASIQYRSLKNSISIQKVYNNYFLFPFFIPFDRETIDSTISTTSIEQKSIKYFIQPSFSIEMKNFHLFLGVALSHQNQFKYDFPDIILSDSIIENIAYDDPYSYNIRNKNLWSSHLFYGIGLGPQFARINLKFAHAFTTDQFNSRFLTFNMGITSNFNIKKENRMNPKFAPSRHKNLF